MISANTDNTPRKTNNVLLQKIQAVYPHVSIVYKSDIDRAKRFDAECLIALNFLKDKYKIEKSTTFSDKSCIEIIDGDRGKNYPNGDDFSDNGHCLFLNTSNVLTDGFNLGKAQFITQKKDEILGNGKLRKNDIVFTTRGTIGNIGIYNEFVLYKNLRINSGMVIFRLKNINPEFFFVLLLSPYIKNQINAFSSGSVQKQIPIDSIEKIQIPILPESFQLEIESIVKSAHEKQTQSKALYQKAEQILLAELGLVNYQSRNDLWFTATKKEVDEAGRFDADYFQPKAKTLRDKFENTNSLKVKQAICAPLASGSTPKAGGNEYEKNGSIKFIRAVNLKEIEINYIDCLYIKEEVHNGLLKRSQLKVGDVLFSIAGVIGRCAVVKQDIKQANINQALAIIRLDTTIFNPYYVALFFSSKFGNQYVNDVSRPVAQTNLNLTELSNVHIPLLPPKIQKQIAGLVQESHRLREASKERLETAKHKVEQEIERLAR